MADLWLNGVNMGLTPSMPADGRCRECGVAIAGIETSMQAPAGRVRTLAFTVDPPKIKGPYFAPCGHDAADAARRAGPPPDPPTVAEARRIVAEYDCVTQGHYWNVTETLRGPSAIVCERCGKAHRVIADAQPTTSGS